MIMAESRHYITLLNGQRIRVAFTLDAYEEIIQTLGMDRFNEIAKGKIDFKGYKVAYLAMVKAGEALDGRKVTFTTDDLGRLISYPQMQELRNAIIEAPKEQFMKAIKNNMLN